MFQKQWKMHLTSSPLLVFISILVVVCAFSTAINDCGVLNGQKAVIAYTITVDKAGRGNFNSVQKAIGSIPPGNNQWVRIHVNPGVYVEKVNIDRPCILLEGSGSTQTIIVSNDCSRTDTSATLTASSDNFVAKNIAFQNSYNRPLENLDQIVPWKPAVAARIYSDKSAFYQVAFIGFQDTLWDVEGRHYYKSCYFEGAVDFIWGSGQTIFEDAVINVTSARLAPLAHAGYITAQGRSSKSDPSGFFFSRGKIYGRGEVYLGRAYGPYSTVVFHGTEMDVVVAPQGWDAWNYVGHEKNFMYAEVGCMGPGSGTSRRVPWERNPNDPELQVFFRSLYNRRRWLANQP